MRVIPPLPITDTRFTSSTVAEPYAPAAYAGGTTYAFDDIVSVAADFTIYKSLQSSNLGHTPSASPTWWQVVGPTETAYNGATTNYALGAAVSANHRVYKSLVLQTASNPLPVWPATSTAFWIDVGPTNKWAMFDTIRNTRTISPSTMTIVVTPGIRVNSFAVMGMRNVSTLHLTAKSPANVLTGTAQAGTARSLTLSSAASITPDAYAGQSITITSGTGVGQQRKVVTSRKNGFAYSADASNAVYSKTQCTVVGDLVTCTAVSDPNVGQIWDTGVPLANRTFTVAVDLWIDVGQPTTGYLWYVYDAASVSDVHTQFIILTTTRTRYTFTVTMAASAANTGISGRIDQQQGQGFVVGNTYHAANWQIVEGADVPYVPTLATAAVGVAVDTPWTTVPDATSVYELGSYDYTATLSTRTVADWYSYFFSDFTYKASEAHFNIPPYSDAVITLTLTALSGNVECGAFVIGSQVYIGATQYNAVSDYVNFSTVTRDFAGKVNTMTQRPGAPKTSQQILVPKAIAQYVKNTVMALDATPAVWSGIDDDTSNWFEPILILGFATSAPMNISYPEHAMLTLDLMEV